LKESHAKEKLSSRKKCKVLKEKLLAAKAEKISREMDPKKIENSGGENFDEKIAKLASELDRIKDQRRGKNKAYSEAMSKLWIDDINDVGVDDNDVLPTVRNSSTREVVGFVTFGGTCFRKSKQIGLGFAPTAAVKQVATS
jgi:hypothetical protein